MDKYLHSEQVYKVPGSNDDALGLELGDFSLERLVGLKNREENMYTNLNIQLDFFSIQIL